MSSFDIDKVTEQLSQTIIEQEGVSFCGKSLKLDTEDDAKEVVEALNNCKHLEFFNLEGNTLGVKAAKAIAKCLESHGELKRALWKDMFTGRMKTEIPEALQYLGSGLMLGGVQLTELDLSDNAFGPIGVQGLASLIKSQTCYSLQIFKLNNNGLGITGGKILSQALIECYEKSKAQGKPLALRVFIAGRNRLENEGAQNLAKFFQKIGTLEELMMPQNGIYHVGIKAICDALKDNPKLKVLNLNDNTFTVRGALALAEVLPSLKEMRELNIGDCILKTKGALLIADALKAHLHLEELALDSNEIKTAGGVAIAKCLENKHNLRLLNLCDNPFGEKGRVEIMDILEKNDQLEFLKNMSNDEDEDEEDEDDEDEDEEDEEEENEEEVVEDEETESDQEKENDVEKININETKNINIIEDETNKVNENDAKNIFMGFPITFKGFLQKPSAENFIKLGNQRKDILLKELKNCNEKEKIYDSIALIMKISSLTINSDKSLSNEAKECSLELYQELIKWGQTNEKFSLITNTLLIHLGLLKSEDKSLKLTWNLDGCFLILKEVSQQTYFPKSIKDIIKCFIERFGNKMKISGDIKETILVF